VLVGLYEEPDKPQQAIEFIKMQLGAPGTTDVEALKAENEQLKSKVEDLQAKLAEATAKLEAPAE
jgi:polyhydroxyalkanoate synthesis regulator phasin